MNPCKKCIVRAGCSKDCMEYDKYVEFASEITTFASMLFGALCFIIMSYFLGVFGPSEDCEHEIFCGIWIFCAIFNVIFNAKHNDMLNDFYIMISGPYITFVFIIMTLLSSSFKINTRKRA